MNSLQFAVRADLPFHRKTDSLTLREMGTILPEDSQSSSLQKLSFYFSVIHLMFKSDIISLPRFTQSFPENTLIQSEI